jgi:hypothetical protein
MTFQCPTDKIKRCTGFAWTGDDVLVFPASIAGVTGLIHTTEDGDEFINQGRGFEPEAGEGRVIDVTKITYHAEQEAFYGTALIFSPLEDIPQRGVIMRSIDGGETWQAVYEEPPYYSASWIAYDDENDRLRALVSRDADEGAFARHLQSSDGLHWSIEGESQTIAGEPPAPALRDFMAPEVITCELTDWLNPSQHLTVYARMAQPWMVLGINGPSQESRLSTIQISRNRQTWISVDTGLLAGLNVGVNCLAAGDGVLIASGGGGIAATRNGTTWSRVVTSTTGPSENAFSCGFVGDQFIALGNVSGELGSRLWFSPDGFDWDSQPLGDVLGDEGVTTSGSRTVALSSPRTAQ